MMHGSLGNSHQIGQCTMTSVIPPFFLNFIILTKCKQWKTAGQYHNSLIILNNVERMCKSERCLAAFACHWHYVCCWLLPSCFPLWKLKSRRGKHTCLPASIFGSWGHVVAKHICLPAYLFGSWGHVVPSTLACQPRGHILESLSRQGFYSLI